MARKTDIIDLTKTKPSSSSIANKQSKIDNKQTCNDIGGLSEIWNRFDKIVCIHYLPYTERLENIKSELKRVGILDLPQFEFYYTIDNDFYRYILDGIPKDKIDSSRMSLSNIKYTIDSYSLLKKL